jgi:hypothetical protein
MIRNPAKALRSGFDDFFTTLRRRRKGSKNHRRRVLSETWLEYQYGWRPLVSDLEGGLDALSRFAQKPIRFKSVSGSGRDERDHSPAPLEVDSGRILYTVNRKYHTIGTARYWGVVELQTGGSTSVPGNLGFRLDRFVPSLWELIPYSFIVDYFSNVGDIISSWAFGMSQVRWVSKTIRTESSYELTVPSYRQNPGALPYTRSIMMMPCKSVGSCVSVTRSPGVSTLVPSFRLEVPGMSSLKWLNLAALGRSRKSLTPF